MKSLFLVMGLAGLLVSGASYGADKNPNCKKELRKTHIYGADRTRI